jgi:hypothetical protein
VDKRSITVYRRYKGGRGIVRGFRGNRGLRFKEDKGSIKVYIRVYNFLAKAVLRLK